MSCDWISGSVEGGLHPPQLLLDLPRLRLTGLLRRRVAAGGQQVDVGGGELGDAPPEVGLQRLVVAVRESRLLEGVDLTHDLGYVPETEQKRTKGKVETCP